MANKFDLIWFEWDEIRVLIAFRLTSTSWQLINRWRLCYGIRCTGADEPDARASAEYQLHHRVVAAVRALPRRDTRLQRLLKRTVSHDRPQRRSHQSAAREARSHKGCSALSPATRRSETVAAPYLQMSAACLIQIRDSGPGRIFASARRYGIHGFSEVRIISYHI